MRGATSAALADASYGGVALSLQRAERVTGLHLRGMAGRPTAEQVCWWYTLGLQTILGFAAPVLYWVCSDARAAARHAAAHGIDPRDRLLRSYRAVCDWLCSGQAALQWVLAAAVALLMALAAAAMLVAGTGAGGG